MTNEFLTFVPGLIWLYVPEFVRFQTSIILNPFGVAIQALVDAILYIELLFAGYIKFSTFNTFKKE